MMLSRSSTLLGIFLAAALPIFGILFLGWDWRSIIIFYWLGNITVGAAVVIGIIRSDRAVSFHDMLGISKSSKSVRSDTLETEAPWLTTHSVLVKLLVIIFFSLHYGIFTSIHGVFVFGLTDGDFFGTGQAVAASSFSQLNLSEIIFVWLITSVIQLAALIYDKRMHISINGAYVRIATLHVSIILGLFLIVVLEWPAITAILLVAIGLFFDLLQYLRASKSSKSEILTATPGVASQP